MLNIYHVGTVSTPKRTFSLSKCHKSQGCGRVDAETTRAKVYIEILLHCHRYETLRHVLIVQRFKNERITLSHLSP